MLPEIAPGWAGAGMLVMGSDWAEEEPQALLAITERLPPVEFAFVLMLLEELLPDQPPGNVQV